MREVFAKLEVDESNFDKWILNLSSKGFKIRGQGMGRIEMVKKQPTSWKTRGLSSQKLRPQSRHVKL